MPEKNGRNILRDEDSEHGEEARNMGGGSQRILRRGGLALLALAMFTSASVPATIKMAVVASANSKLSDIPFADLVKLCKGTSNTWPDGKSFVLILKNPDSPEMHGVLQKLFGTGVDPKAAIAKLNETKQTVRIVATDEELLRAVDATAGAIGIVDVYAINSSVKVLRIDGKVPFDVGYVLRGN